MLKQKKNPHDSQTVRAKENLKLRHGVHARIQKVLSEEVQL